MSIIMSILTRLLNPVTESIRRLTHLPDFECNLRRVRINISRRVLQAGFLASTLAALLLATVRFEIKGHFEGVFLLHGSHDWRVEVKDYLYVGDGERLIFAFDWDDPRYRVSRLIHREDSFPYIYYEWDPRDGSGFIRNILGNGRETFTSFGRFMDDSGKYVHGLFVGGTLPANIIGNDNAAMNESGMAYREGSRWYHIWCNVNEALISPYTRAPLPPSEWRFLGSRIIDGGSKGITLSSSHRADMDGASLEIDRFVYLRAGDTYFLLTVRIANVGTVPANFYYVYGDEPWVGNYGSSRGNVGWVGDRIIDSEGVIDSRKYSYAGMYDYGNSSIGEDHDSSTGIANFIQWFGKDRPEVYFANGSDGVSDRPKRVPLSGDTRFIGLQWGPRQLSPGEAAVYVMAIGMAGQDPITKFPRKPDIRVDPVLLNRLAEGRAPVDFTRSAPR